MLNINKTQDGWLDSGPVKSIAFKNGEVVGVQYRNRGSSRDPIVRQGRPQKAESIEPATYPYPLASREIVKLEPNKSSPLKKGASESYFESRTFGIGLILVGLILVGAVLTLSQLHGGSLAHLYGQVHHIAYVGMEISFISGVVLIVKPFLFPKALEWSDIFSAKMLLEQAPPRPLSRSEEGSVERHSELPGSSPR